MNTPSLSPQVRLQSLEKAAKLVVQDPIPIIGVQLFQALTGQPFINDSKYIQFYLDKTLDDEAYKQLVMDAIKGNADISQIRKILTENTPKISGVGDKDVRKTLGKIFPNYNEDVARIHSMSKAQ